MKKDTDTLQHCLYFSANSLARVISRMAEEEFRVTGLSPSHAFVMMMVHAHKDIGPKELSDKLHLAPSTVTRFVDHLVQRSLLQREFDGKTARLRCTRKGQEIQADIRTAWQALYKRYSTILGLQAGLELTAQIHQACDKLGE
jgi:MarR family transcriptional regulator, organic hydroperoxide resistance regulator